MCQRSEAYESVSISDRNVELRVHACRFDVAHAISVLSRHLHRPTDRLLKAAYRVLQYLKTTCDFEMMYTTLMSDYENLYRNFFYCAADALFAFCPITRRSHKGG